VQQKAIVDVSKELDTLNFFFLQEFVTFVLLRREEKVRNSFGLRVSVTFLNCKYEVLYCPVIHCGGL